MSENLDLVRSVVAGWERGDWRSDEWLDPDVEYVITDGPQPGTWFGRAAMAEAFRDFLHGLEEYRLTGERYRLLADGRVLVLVHATGRGKSSGLELGEVGANCAAVFEVRNGLVVKLAYFWDRDRALAELAIGPEDDGE
jgi:ketosteroid isomerase-like protein